MQAHLPQYFFGGVRAAGELHADVVPLAYFLDLVREALFAHALDRHAVSAIGFYNLGEMRGDLIHLRIFKRWANDVGNLVLRHNVRCLPLGVRLVPWPCFVAETSRKELSGMIPFRRIASRFRRN